MTEKPRETQAESHVVELKEKVNNSSLMKHLNILLTIIYNYAGAADASLGRLPGSVQGRGGGHCRTTGIGVLPDLDVLRRSPGL